ncbi:MAG: phosphohydrolase [Verrucomicrobiota bacterium JB023]|nr:phosphohydrolase [Verrucomicrobiota bacterium JB023]
MRLKSDHAKLVIEEIVGLFRRRGQEGYGEDVSQTQHAVQVGLLAMKDGQPDEVVVAGFLHDIAHLLDEPGSGEDGYGTPRHDTLGGIWARDRGFPEVTARVIENHVTAKRYLTAREEGYYDKLSLASKMTLKQQGGPMTEEEADAFEKDPHFELHIKMRRWDELGKDEEADLEDIDQFRPYLERVLA